MSAAVDRPAAGRTRALAFVAGLCVVQQAVSATFVVRDLETPNYSTRIAQNLVRDGAYVAPNAYGPPASAADQPRPLRAYHLPGEPLFLAAGFAILPKALWRYLHVLVTAVLVTSIAAVGLALGGPRLALAAGLAAAIDPFTFVHGPVWDDMFLAAALEWLVFALLVMNLGKRRDDALPTHAQLPTVLAVAFCAGWAALTRVQSQAILVCVAIAAIAAGRLRPIRGFGWAIVLALGVAVTVWGMRNYVVLGTFYAGSTHDGPTLYESIGPDARARLLSTGTTDGSVPGAFDQQLPASFGELAIDRAYRRAALSYVTSHPADAALTSGLKLAVSLTGIDLGQPLFSGRNVAATVSNLLLLVLGPYGLWLLTNRAWSDPPQLLALLICVVTTTVTVALLLIGPNGLRYRISLTGFLYLGAGAAVLRATTGRDFLT